MGYNLNKIKSLAIFTTALLLSGCGQRGPLFMPTIPPLPQPIQPTSPAQTPTSSSSSNSVPAPIEQPILNYETQLQPRSLSILKK